MFQRVSYREEAIQPKQVTTVFTLYLDWDIKKQRNLPLPRNPKKSQFRLDHEIKYSCNKVVSTTKHLHTLYIVFTIFEK